LSALFHSGIVVPEVRGFEGSSSLTCGICVSWG